MGRKKAELVSHDGKVFMIMHVLEPMEDENGKTYFKEYDMEEDITGREDRESDFCKICEFGKYPECMSWCERYKAGL